MELPSSTAAPHEARQLLAAELERAGLSRESVGSEVVQLILSEIVTNAVIHSDPPITVLADVIDQFGINVAVADGSPEFEPHRRWARIEEPGGWGLELVDRLANSWGISPRPDRAAGKLVWAWVSLCPAPIPA